MGFGNLFGGLKSVMGEGLELVNQGKELIGTAQEGLSALLTQDLSGEQLSQIGENLKQLATTGRDLADQLPESGIKRKILKGLDMVCGLNPQVNGQPVSLQEATEGKAGIDEWVTGLYQALSGEHGDQNMIDRVKQVINYLQKLL